MRALTPTLLAAQQSASARPYFRVRLYDRDVGTVRLRWQRWYTGAEPDGPCAAALTAGGALLRARIDPSSSALSHQRVAAPSATSGYASWTALGAVAVAPRLGLAAAGTRALIATVRGDGVSVEVRESTDSGASFAASTVTATAGGSVTAVACTLQSDGSAALLYAVAGTVYALTRSGVGAWSAAVAWTLSLASVSAIAAYFELDHNVLVSGVTAAGEAGVWSTILGAGGTTPPGLWPPLAELALASAGTDVSYLATGATRAGVPRGLFVESFSGGGAYDRVHVADGVTQTGWNEFKWREPRPFERASAYGLAVVNDPADGWLCAPDGVWHAAIAVIASELTGDVLWAELRQGEEPGRLRLTLRNDDGRYAADSAPAALAIGGELTVDVGYETVAGLESSAGPVFWIDSLRRARRDGAATVEVGAVDGWGLLAAWTAPRQFVWDAGARSVSQLLELIAGKAGLSFAVSDASAESTALKPAFTVRAGERGSAAVGRLLAMISDTLLIVGRSAVLRGTDARDTTDYAFGDAHALRSFAVDEGRRGIGWARVFGDGLFAEAVDAEVLRDGGGAAIAVDGNLTTQARVAARAGSLLRRDVLAIGRGELTALVNAGQEVADVVTIADPASGMRPFPYSFPLSFAPPVPTKFRVAALRLRYLRAGQGARYETTLTLMEV
ncbi:MAG: hypothetical protein V3R95_02835 [Dehalococcoidia bacterium]